MYSPGDPPKSIDWRVFARTDQLIVREEHFESSASVLIVCDLSKSMMWPEKDSTAFNLSMVSKFEIAYRVAMHLAFFHLRLGNRVSFWCITEETSKIPEKSNPFKSSNEVLSFYSVLEKNKFQKESISEYCQKKEFNRCRYEFSYWIGDMLGDGDHEGCLSLGKNHSLIHVLHSLEMDPQWVDKNSFYFDKSKGTKEYTGKSLQDIFFKEKIDRWIHDLSVSQSLKKGHYLQVTELTPMEKYFTFVNGTFCS